MATHQRFEELAEWLERRQREGLSWRRLAALSGIPI